MDAGASAVSLRWDRFVRFALGAAMAISFLTLGTAALYALPNGDGFCRASLQPLISTVVGWEPSTSAVDYAADSYQFWTGRWASMWIEAAVLSTVDIIGAYPITLLGIMAIILPCLWLVVRAALPHTNAVLGTALLFTLYWANMPAPGESLFWFTGAIENTVPVAVGAAMVAILSSGRMRWAAAVLSVLVPGLHELYGAILIVVLCAGAFLIWLADRRISSHWIVCTALALVSEVIVYAAPGNAIRAAYLPEASAIPSVKLTAWQLFQFLPDWSLSGSLLAATFAILAVRPKVEWAQDYFPGWRLAIIPALTVGLVILAIAGSTYLQTAPLAGRTLAGVYFVFLIGWILTAIGLAQRIEGPQKTLASLCGLALAATLILQGNTRTALFDLKDRVTPWHHAMQARYASLRTGNGLVLVPPPPTTPHIFFWRDILEDPKDFRNVCVARYFRLDSVAIIPRR
jgi:hypothetical protein